MLDAVLMPQESFIYFYSLTADKSCVIGAKYSVISEINYTGMKQISLFSDHVYNMYMNFKKYFYMDCEFCTVHRRVFLCYHDDIIILYFYNCSAHNIREYNLNFLIF
jgi:hypothetical protein